MKILSPGITNAKLKKNKGAYLSAIFYGAPADTSGKNACPNSTPECRRFCLFKSGFASVYPTVNAARVRKTQLFWSNRPKFMRLLFKDLTALQKKAQKLYELEEGDICLDGISLKEVAPRSLRPRVGVVVRKAGITKSPEKGRDLNSFLFKLVPNNVQLHQRFVPKYKKAQPLGSLSKFYEYQEEVCQGNQLLVRERCIEFVLKHFPAKLTIDTTKTY